MNITARAALLAAYYPFQLRVSAVLLQNNIVFMGIISTLCLETCLQEPVKTKISSMVSFDQSTGFEQINDTDLNISVLKAWDKLKDIISQPTVIIQPQ